MQFTPSSIVRVASYSISSFTINDFVNSTTHTIVEDDSVQIPCYIYWYNQYIAIPVICIAGLVANVFSGIVVFRSGLKKPSNIFIFGLAVADTFMLLKVFIVIEYLYLIPDDRFKECNIMRLPYVPAVIIWTCSVALYVITNFGQRLATVLTVVITFERLIAVFFPLRFARIATSKRAWLVLLCSILFWLPWSIFQCFWFNFQHEYNTKYGTYMGRETNTDYLKGKYFDTSYFNATVINHLTHTIPWIMVIVGCTAIGIKISKTSKERKRLLSSAANERSSSRTTKTLLMVCLGYSLSRGCFLLRYLTWFDDDNVERITSTIIYFLVRDRLADINSASNFFIYVAFNKKFRNILASLWFPGCQRP